MLPQGEKIQLDVQQALEDPVSYWHPRKPVDNVAMDSNTSRVINPTACLYQMTEDRLHRQMFRTADDLTNHFLSQRDVEPAKQPRWQLYTLQSLPLDFVQVFGLYLDLDPTVINSQASRNTQELLSCAKRHEKDSVQLFCMDHVEWSYLPSSTIAQHSSNLMPAMETLSKRQGDSKTVPLASHITLWTRTKPDGYTISLVFFDDPLWTHQRDPAHRAVNQSALFSQMKRIPSSARIWHPVFSKDESTASLEEMFFEDMEGLIGSGRGPCDFLALVTYLQRLSLNRWARLMEDSARTPQKHNSIDWFRVQQCLSKNLSMSLQLARLSGSEFTTRIDFDHQNLQRLMQSAQFALHMYHLTALKKTQIAGGEKLVRQLDHQNKLMSRSPAPVETDRASNLSVPEGKLVGADGNEAAAQQAINRVTYLGAILLPFSIMAGVFSMGGDYLPGQPLFWLFFAVSVPFSLLTLAIIYADTIRRMTIDEFASIHETSQMIAAKVNSSVFRPTILHEPCSMESNSVPLRSSMAIPQTATPYPMYPAVVVEDDGHGHEGIEPVRVRLSSTPPVQLFSMPEMSRLSAPARLPQLIELRPAAQMGWLRAFGTIFGYKPRPTAFSSD